MKKPATTLDIDGHRNSPVINLSFEKDPELIGKRLSAYERSVTTEIPIYFTEESFSTTPEKLRFCPEFGCVSGSMLPANTGIKGMITFHKRWHSKKTNRYEN